MYQRFRHVARVDFAEQLARSLRRAREDAGLTHREMARRLGISHATYTRIENVNQNVTLKTLTQLCRSLNCDMGTLFSGGVRVRDVRHRRAAPSPATAKQGSD